MSVKTTVNRSRSILAIEGTISSGEVRDAVYPSGDNAFSKAGADCANVVGILAYKASDGKGTVETFYNHELDVEFDGAVAAGEFVKIGADNPSSEQCYKKWVQGVDNESLRCGLCIKGGADEEIGTILV